MDKLDQQIQKLQESNLPAETRNALHGATSGHPWCEGKDIGQRAREVLFSIAGRPVDAWAVYQVERILQEAA